MLSLHSFEGLEHSSLLHNPIKEHLISSTVGHTIKGSPRPKGFLSSDTPADIENANSAIHFSSREPRDENCYSSTTLVQKLYSY
ncbi:hypothetical protein HanPSC8_Chr01g0006351 [Helianthus annuus]|nr:hypothetical protein HanPSC8_Chr01g0006351 [Helianthus annuus]